MILYLECHRGKQRKILTAKRQSKKVGCSFKVRVVYFSSVPGVIYAEKLAGHTNHDPTLVAPKESIPETLHSALYQLFRERNYGGKQAFMHLSRFGRSQFHLSEDVMSWLTMSACQRARKQFIATENKIVVRNDELSCKALKEANEDSFLYLVDEPGDWQIAFMTQEQRQVLQVCSKMIFIDACHSLNKKGELLSPC
jgi:hypothetical protein